MKARLRVQEQHVAVFGGSGSGKTVLLSSFYGATQEPEFQRSSLFDLFADETGQGTLLRSNYLNMKRSGKTPQPTRFQSIPYRFTLRPKAQPEAAFAKARAFDEVQLVWHDYPGEWFEEEPSSPEEANRRLATFRRLLRSDVALLLVDGQKLLDYAGEEEKYLKSLIWGIREGLMRLRTGLLDNGKKLDVFPRIWVVALSKADLHPEMAVRDFQDLVIEKAAGDLVGLQNAIRQMVEYPEALSVGEDFMLLSSAKFGPDRIQVTERVGIDLILPVALILPLERVVQWYDRFDLPRAWLDKFAENADSFAAVLAGSKVLNQLLRRVPKVGDALAVMAIPVITGAVRVGGTQLKQLNAAARSKQDYLAAMLTQFQLDLRQGEQSDLLVTRRK